MAAANGNNVTGVSGVAPAAELTGLRLISSFPGAVNPIWDPTNPALNATGGFNSNLIARALGHENDDIDIYNNSWGFDSSYRVPLGAGPLYALREA